MKVGILKTGRPPRAEIPRFGTYSDMFQRLLGDGFDYQTFAADEGDLPESPTACDAYLITGGASGAYDSDPWIGQTLDFLRAAKGQAALVGVCLGHQLMAQAFGGQVIQSPKGWGVGEHDYRVVRREAWMDGAAQDALGTIRLPASHQDQVVEKPPGAQVWAASDFTPFAGLVWPGERAISLQPHPEFEPAYAKALIEGRRGSVYPPDQADRAVASFSGADDRARVGGWIKRFLTSAT